MAARILPLPNLLATKSGRLAAFFALYVTEGIPLGFAATAVATQLRRQGVGPAEVGAFIGSFYLPWAFKWAFGPIVDVFAWERVGRRRGWILLTQLLMTATLLSTVLLELPAQIGLFTIILLVHNVFGATQDVAIDALACNTLEPEERGLANGMMFAGAYVGNMLGGGGVLFLSTYTGFQPTFFFVAGAILLVTIFVVLPMREPVGAPRPPIIGSRWRAAGREMHTFAIDSFRSFLGTRGAFAGVFFALLPPGAMCLGLALQANLGVELGMKDEAIGRLALTSAIISAIFCVIGGALSDRLGRRKTLFAYITLLGLPVLALMGTLTHHGWIMPVAADAPNRPVAPEGLVTAFWITSAAYSAFQGLMYGTRSAIVMDVTNPAVAGTQFTAYMALANVAIAYSATWQGIAIEAWGYPRMMLIDVMVGVLCLAIIPFLRPTFDAPGVARFLDHVAPRRARFAAGLLGVLCLAWVPTRLWEELLGPARPVAGTFFTLVFVCSALFLLAGGAVLAPTERRLARIGAWFAPFLLLMYLRYYVEPIGAWLKVAKEDSTFHAVADAIALGVPTIGGVLLLTLASRGWEALRPVDNVTNTAA